MTTLHRDEVAHYASQARQQADMVVLLLSTLVWNSMDQLEAIEKLTAKITEFTNLLSAGIVYAEAPEATPEDKPAS